REILLRVRRGVRGDVVREGGGDAPALEVDPLRVGDAIRLAHLSEGPPEPAGPGERPIVIEERVPQLVQNQPAQHVPGDLVPPPQPHWQRRWYLNPFGALSGSGLEARSAMSRPHQGQNEKLSDTTQPQ